MKILSRCVFITVLILMQMQTISAQGPEKKSPRKYPAVSRKVPVKRNSGPLTDVKSKEIVSEIACTPTATIFIENMFRSVKIIGTNENKVRLVTTVNYQGNPSYTDGQWMDKLGLGISGTAANVVVKSFGRKTSAAAKVGESAVINRRPDTIANGIAVFDSSGEWINRKSDIRRNLVLYVPAGARLDIESQYSDITLDNNAKYVKLRLTNGSITMKNADQLIANTTYGNIFAEDIAEADIDISNGKLEAKFIQKLKLNSQNSFVELNSVEELSLTSNTDNIDIEQLGSLKGSKLYGDIRITVLLHSIELTGKNADLKIRRIEGSVSLVKIDNQYADLRLPVGNLKNYAVHFEGSGGNVYASFEKNKISDTSFKASVGNQSDGATGFMLKCDNCTVDFK